MLLQAQGDGAKAAELSSGGRTGSSWSRPTLKHSSFRSPRAVRDRNEAFIQTYNTRARPFRWRASQVHPSAPKRSIANLSK